MDNYVVRLAEHLKRHKILPCTFEAWALRFREVVLDMRAVRARRLHEYIVEFEPHSCAVQYLKRICFQATEFLHVDALGFLLTERECPCIIAQTVSNGLS